MNVYICYSTKDKQEVDRQLELLDTQENGLNVLILNNKAKLWKMKCLPKIQKSQMMIFFVGDMSHESPNIGWELNQAIQNDIPVYTIKINADNQIHENLFYEDKYSHKEKRYDKEVTIEQLKNIIKNYREENYNVINNPLNEKNTETFLEQYKIFLQTSEDLVERRQNVNNFYITINSAFIALFGTLLTFDIETLYIVIIGGIFSVIGIILCISWIKILDSYGLLNTSKMKIIGCLERQLPANLYAAEWEAMSDRLNKKKYISFTESEKQIPKIFIVLYILLIIVLFLYFLFKH